jgi:hypothetical protein
VAKFPGLSLCKWAFVQVPEPAHIEYPTSKKSMLASKVQQWYGGRQLGMVRKEKLIGFAGEPISWFR